MRGHYWVSCLNFTIAVEVNEAGVIIAAAPIVRRFIGQDFTSLLAWAKRLGGLYLEKL